MAAVAHVEVELAHSPMTSAGVVVGEATGPTSVVAVVAEMVDVMAVAMAVEATDAGATHVTDVADHPHIVVVETEGIAGVIHEKWKDAKEGASSASKKDTLRHTALKEAAEEEIREIVPLVAIDVETIACVVAMAEMALPAAKCRGAAHRQESAPNTTTVESTVPVTDGTNGTTVHATVGITVLVTEVPHLVATTEKKVEALAT